MNDKLDEDTQLMIEFQQGNLDAYIKLYQKYFLKITRFCWGFDKIITDEIAEDMAQKAFIKVYTHKDSYAQLSRFNTWLCAIARNLTLNEIRKFERRETSSLTPLTYADREGDEELENQLIDFDAENPAEIKDYTPVIEEIAKYAKEGHVHFTSFFLHHIQGLSYKNISGILNVPVGTAKNRVYKCRKSLARRLENYRAQFPL